jgi:hypothetical protein
MELNVTSWNSPGEDDHGLVRYRDAERRFGHLLFPGSAQPSRTAKIQLTAGMQLVCKKATRQITGSFHGLDPPSTVLGNTGVVAAEDDGERGELGARQ